MQESTRRKLDYLNETKQQIKQALIDKGQEVSTEDPFRAYVNKVEEIETTPETEEVTVNPTIYSQTINPSANKLINKVKVNAVTNAIDNNIIPENIKKDAVILGVTGTYENEELIRRVEEMEDQIDELQEERDQLLDNQIWKTTEKLTGITVTDAADYDKNKLQLFGNIEQVTSILPEGYTQLDYIELTGTQYINTGIKPTDNIGIETKIITSPNFGGTDIILCGSRDSEGNRYFIYAPTSNSTRNKLGVGWGINKISTISMDVSTEYLIHFNFENSKKVQLDNQEVINLQNDIFAGNDIPMCIGCCNNNGNTTSYFSGKIKYLKITDSTTLIRHFIPCKNSNNEVGLYDLVTQAFFGNQGTGDFIAGDEVTIPNPDCKQEIQVVRGEQKVCTGRLPAGYTELDYVESTGMQYIDTGVKCSQDMSCEITNSFNTLTGTQIFGAYQSPNRVHYGITNSEMYMPTSRNAQTTEHTFSTDTDFHKYFLSSTTYKYDEIIVATGTFDFPINLNFYLFARNLNGIASNFSSSKLSEAKFYDSNTLIRDFIPAKRNSDSVLGLYDLVTNTFFTNQGTGAFVAGNIVRKELPLNLRSRNLYNNNLEITRYYYNSSGVLTLGSNGDTFIETIINENIANNYIISFNKKVGTSYARFSFFNEEKFISRNLLSTNGETVTVPEGTTKIYVHTDKRETKYFEKLQIEEGTKVTENQEYYDYELAKINDNIDIIFHNERSSEYYNSELDEGKWYVKNQTTIYQFAGNEAYKIVNSNNNNSTVFICNLPNSANILRNSGVYCNMFVENIDTGLLKKDYGCRITEYSNQQRFQFCLPNSDGITTLEQGNQFLAERKPVIRYNLTTPIYTEVTDETLITQLDTIYEHLKLIKGMNGITVTAEDLAPHMQLTYIQDVTKL